MGGVAWSAAATADIDRIEAYLDGIDAGIAEDTIDALITAAASLSTFPARGTPLDDGYRAIAAKRTGYRIIYTIEAGGVVVLRIRHEREDWR